MNKNTLKLQRETLRSLSGKRTQLQTGVQQLGTPDMRGVNGGIFWSLSLCGGPSREIGESIGGSVSGAVSAVSSAVGSASASAISSAVSSAVVSGVADTPVPVSDLTSAAVSASASAVGSATVGVTPSAESGWDVSRAVSGFISTVLE